MFKRFLTSPRIKLLRRVAKRTLVAGLALLAALLFGAYALQKYRTASAEQRNPAPGQFAEVGGHRLHYQVLGNGPGPIVILQAGMGESGTYTWFGVEKEIAKFSRVLTYDRSGLGWSDVIPGPSSPDREVRNLRILLNQAQLDPPYLLVGHSRGGFISRLFASLHPEDTAGLVMVDAFDTDTFKAGAPIWQIPFPISFLHTARDFGAARIFYSINIPRNRLAVDAELLKTYLDMQSRPRNFHAFVEEWRGLSNWLELRDQLKAINDTPVTVLTCSETAAQFNWDWWPKAQDELANNVGNNVTRVRAKCGHYIQAENPEILIDTVRNCYEEITASGIK